MPDVCKCAIQGVSNALCPCLVTLEQMQCHSLGGLAANAGKAAEGLDQFVETG